MTVGGGGGGGGEGISAIRELVTSLRLGATAVTKLFAAACAGAGTGWLPACIISLLMRSSQRELAG